MFAPRAAAFTLAFVLAPAWTPGTFAADHGYTIEIDGKRYQIELGKDYGHTTAGGDTIRYKVDRADVVRYRSDLLSFDHKSEYTPTRSEIGEGRFQTLLVSGQGNGVLIQEYATMNPSTLVDFMLREITKEDVEYGHQLKEYAYKKTLPGGQVLTGKRARLRYNGSETTYTVSAFGERDRGVLVVTMLHKDDEETEGHIIDLMWNTLELDP